MPLTTRCIVITGATRGLGRVMVDSFMRLGHTVIGCGRSAERIAELSRRGPPHDFQVVDVADDAAVGSWAARVLEEFGPPSLLLNNAAIMNEPAPLWEVKAEEFNRLIDVNIKGSANIIRHFVPAMVARGNGVIVNLSSGWGRSTSPNVAPYCASKWAIEGLTRALAQELPKGMAAVSLNPGIIDTDMLRTSFGDRSSGFIGPDEWAEAAVPFLLDLGSKDNGKPLTAPGQ
jgi:NAD(P)-dependent dehydrogenase (short-subunit alcohol dehydrogenase family)